MQRGKRLIIRLGWAALLITAAVPASGADDTAKAIATIKAVTREGKGNDAAGPAWKALVAQGPAALFPTLEAIDDANPTAANWLRTAVDAIAENEMKAGRTLPADKLEAFVTNTKFAPSARRLAFELLVKQNPEAKDRLLPRFLDDPSADLRRDAVAAEFGRASDKADLQKVLSFARDKDQIEAIARKLEDDYKLKVSISEHFAFVTHWHLIGPFDSAEGKALTLSYPPEKAKDTTGKFKGKGGEQLTWKPHVTTDKYGVVNLNKAVGKHKDAAVYALAVLLAEKETPCEIRVGCINAIQIFLNGAKLFEREEYHHGMPMDHNVAKGTLARGANVIVLKVCQNNQTDSWAQDWMFQLRVCDATGGPLPGVKQVVSDGDKMALIKLGHIPATEEKK
ncbi:MAG TPA: hypothetical protein VKE74_25655 [Gemmataceae bacterium]|nr:hypothetical protein [Gemmataceae bacterium]